MRRLSPDLVHTWIFAANCYGRQAALNAGVPRIVSGERCVDRWKVWYELAIDRHLARRTDRIAANSAAVRDFYVGRGIPAEKFVIIPNGVPLFRAAETPDRETLLHSLGLPAECRLIGAVGRLWPQKRIKDLIWAAELLKAIRDDTHLLIVGEGPQRWRLQRYSELVGVDDRVHLLGGRDDVSALLPQFDCLWLASAYEGQSNAVMEAMAAGIPVIATDIPGNRDLITNAESGWLAPVGDRAAFARLTNQLLEDPPLAQRIGRAGQARMRQHFSVERMAQRYGELYRELTS
jgi:glycosyltransferase involved in cell wall biosynthesis